MSMRLPAMLMVVGMVVRMPAGMEPIRADEILIREYWVHVRQSDMDGRERLAAFPCGRFVTVFQPAPDKG